MTLDEFNGSDFGCRCAAWLKSDLKENGPMSWSTLGQGRFLPEEVSVGDWLSTLDGVFSYPKGGGRDYCESIACSPDDRPIRTKPSCLPKWMLHPVLSMVNSSASVQARRCVGGKNTVSGPRLEKEAEKRGNDILIRRRKNILIRFMKWLWRLCSAWASGECRHVSEEEWMLKLKKLKENRTWTAEIHYRDRKRPSFTATSFEDGDENVILVSYQGECISVRREDVLELKLKTTKPSIQTDGSRRASGASVGYEGEGRVSSWRIKQDGNGYGYVIDKLTAESFFFSNKGVLDTGLQKSLNEGKYGQIVQFTVVRESQGRMLGVVQISKMLRDFVYVDQQYKQGHMAMVNGDLDRAAFLLEAVVDNVKSPSRLSALKDLGEVYNRLGRMDEAYELIERNRSAFPDEDCSFEMMEELYLERMQRWEDARDKVKALLEREDFSQRLHYEKKLSRLVEKCNKGRSETDGSKSLQDWGEDEKVANSIRREGLSASVLDKLSKMQPPAKTTKACRVNEVVKQLRNFSGVIGWKRRLELCNNIKDLMSSDFVFSDVIAEALSDVLDKENIRLAAAPVPLSVKCRNTRLRVDNDGYIAMQVDLRLEDESAVPLRDLCVTLADDHNFVIPAPLMGLTTANGTVSVGISFKPTDREIAEKRGEAVVRVTYERELPTELGAQMDDMQSVDGPVEERIEFQVGDVAFEPIEDPFLVYCNHVARGEFFVGRAALLKDIVNVLTRKAGGQSFVLYGQARSGKSSIRLNLRQALKDRLDDSHLLYTETSGHMWTSRMLESDPLSYLAYDLKVSAVAKLKSINAWSEETGAEFCDIPKGYDVEKILFLGRLLRANGVKWIVAIDEFTDLYDLLVHARDDRGSLSNRMLDLLRALKALLEVEDPILNILMIGQDSMEIFLKDYANKFSVSKCYRVTYLDKESTLQLLQVPLKGKVLFTEEALDRYYYYVGGYPLYAMDFCSRIVEFVNKSKFTTVKAKDIDSIAEIYCNGDGNGDGKAREEEFHPFVQLEIPEILGEDIMSVYYEIADRSANGLGCPKDVFQGKERLFEIFKVLESRGVFHDNQDGTFRLRMGLFAQYLRANRGLGFEDLLSVKGRYNV